MNELDYLHDLAQFQLDASAVVLFPWASERARARLTAFVQAHVKPDWREIKADRGAGR